MSEIILWAVIFGVVFFILLILRFLQPELIYTLRQSVAKVENNKVWLDAETEEEEDDYFITQHRKTLAKDFRPESRRSDLPYVQQRITKVKELYNLQHDIGNKEDVKNCIVELANLLSNISQNITIDNENRYSLTHAKEIMEFLRDKRVDKDHIPREPNLIEEWFDAYPISVEQSVEVLIAVINTLLIRESANL